MEFFSPEYMEELKRQVNSDSLFLSLNKPSRNSTYTFRAEEEPENLIEGSIVAGFSVVDGKVNEVWTGRSPKTDLTDLVFSGKYGIWVDVLKRRLTFEDALLTHKIVLQGETDQIYGPTVWMEPGPLYAINVSKAADRIVEIARTIPTHFQGKYASTP